MNPTPSTPTIGQALTWAFQRLNEELRTVFILSALLMVIFLIAFTPLFGFYLELFGAMVDGQLEPEQMAALDISGWAALFSIVVAFAGSSAIYVLLARLTDLEHSELLEGGFGALANRALWIVWRLICASGWIALSMIVMMVAMMIVLFAVGALVTAIFGQGASVGVLALTAFIFYAAMIVVFVSIYGALSVSIYAASRDTKIGILATWNALKGCRRRLVLANVVIYLVVMVVYVPVIFLAAALFAVLGGLALVLYLVLASLIAGLYAFLWLAVGAAFANYALART